GEMTNTNAKYIGRPTGTACSHRPRNLRAMSVLGRSCRKIAISPITRFSANSSVDGGLEFAEITALVPFSTPTPVNARERLALSTPSWLEISFPVFLSRIYLKSLHHRSHHS